MAGPSRMGDGMTVSTLTSTISYTESADPTYPVPFRFLANVDLRVVRIEDGEESILVLGTDYSVAGANAIGGGSITRLRDAHVGATLIISRRTVPVQPTDYVANDRFPAESHERALDRLTLIAQENTTRAEDTEARALRVPAGETAQPLPPADERAGKFAVFGPGGQMTYASGTGSDADLREDLASDPGAGIVNFSWEASYADASAGAKLQRGPIDLSDPNFGLSTGNSASANSLAAGRAMDKADSWQGADIRLRPGRGGVFNLNQAIELPGSTRLLGAVEGNAAYGEVYRSGSALRMVGADWLIKAPRTGGNKQMVQDVLLIGSDACLGGISTGDGDGQEEFTSEFRTCRVHFTGFQKEGAIALDVSGVQRGLHMDLRFINNYTHIDLGFSGGNDFIRGNMSQNHYQGRAIAANRTGNSAVNFSMLEFYFESCPGERPFDFSNNGVYSIQGGGCEAMCFLDGTEIEDPTIFYFGGGASGRVYLRSAAWGMSAAPGTGADITGRISFVRKATGLGHVEAGAMSATMNYTGGGRSGVEYKFWDAALGYGPGIIPLPGRYLWPITGTVAEARAAYAIGNNITYSAYKPPMLSGITIDVPGQELHQPSYTPYHRTAPLLTDGAVARPNYTGEVSGPATTTIASDTFEAGELQAPQTVILHLQGRRTGTAGGKKLRLKLSQAAVSDKYIDITLDATTADAFSAEVRFRVMGRLHQLVTVKLDDGSTRRVVHTQLLSGSDLAPVDLINRFTMAVEAVVASSPDKMMVYDIAWEIR
ncbi:MAG: hypothetical protein ACOY5R_06525 [Pseudomonadota bacterium]